MKKIIDVTLVNRERIEMNCDTVVRLCDLFEKNADTETDEELLNRILSGDIFYINDYDTITVYDIECVNSGAELTLQSDVKLTYDYLDEYGFWEEEVGDGVEEDVRDVSEYVDKAYDYNILVVAYDTSYHVEESEDEEGYTRKELVPNGYYVQSVIRTNSEDYLEYAFGKCEDDDYKFVYCDDVNCACHSEIFANRDMTRTGRLYNIITNEFEEDDDM